MPHIKKIEKIYLYKTKFVNQIINVLNEQINCQAK